MTVTAENVKTEKIIRQKKRGAGITPAPEEKKRKIYIWSCFTKRKTAMFSH